MVLPPSSALSSLSPRTLQCIKRLAQHSSPQPDLSGQPSTTLAAVLVLLFERDGELRVLLTTRSKHLRTHAGQTALPGGKMDTTDETLLGTALREAHEEVGLPLDLPSLHVLTLLEPFLSLHKLLVTPVVVFLVDPSVLGELKASESEVSRIFTHPLEALLDPSLSAKESLAPQGSEDWPYEADYYHTTDSTIPFLSNTTYRMHRFRSCASPIKGLTSDILIKVAEIAFDKATVYERFAIDQLHGFDAIQHIIKAKPE
ncbi:hypothetical protein AX16_002401 [Volvariella volvacea WC 439]|nr:hypothetical protein AX16_002401 [Volvariella volvacea WC 439]